MNWLMRSLIVGAAAVIVIAPRYLSLSPATVALARSDEPHHP